MADEAGDKTEEPTPYALRKARERGEVAVSRDLTSALLLAAAAGVLAYQAEHMGGQLQAMTRTAIARASMGRISTGDLLGTLGEMAVRALYLLAPVLAALFVLAILAPLLQVGPLLVLEPLKPQLERLNPVAGLKRTLFSLRSYVELLKGALKLVVVGVLCFEAVYARFGEVALLMTKAPTVAARVAGSILMTCVIRSVLSFLGLAVLDVFYQRWQYRKQHRMTKQQIKEEYKEQEGDPHHKQARKQLHQEIAMSTRETQARKADVMIANPDHVVCALRYDPNEEGAPRLLAKGQGYLAERLKEIAREEDIPIVRDVSLARALYELEEDELIPEELYQAVSEVLKWVESVARERGELPAWVDQRPERSA